MSAVETRKPRRRSDEIAALLLDRVTNGHLRPGDRLPPERELAEELGASRTVIREAISMLAGKGVLLSMVGSGLKITAVDGTTASESLGLYLVGNRVDYRRIHEVRELIEVQVAGLAAQTARPEDLEELQAACEQMAGAGDDLEQRALADLRFHRALIPAAGNEIYGVLLDSLHQGLIEVRKHNLINPQAIDEAVASHELIRSAVAAGDIDGARQAMALHLRGVLDFWTDGSGA